MHRQVVATFLLLITAFSGLIQPAEAITGNETITHSNIETDKMNITVTNLDLNENYKWYLAVYYPSGSYCSGVTGYMYNPSATTLQDEANWGPCRFQGNYTFTLRLQTSSNVDLAYHNGTYYSPGTNNTTSQDWYEPNDGQSAAIQINTFTNYSNLTLHDLNNEDWFWFNVTGNQNIWVNLSQNHEEMDAQIYAWQDQGSGFKSQLDHSDSETDFEFLFFNSSTTVNNTWRILLQVLASGGAAGYNLSIEHHNRTTPMKNIADNYEPNEAINQSYTIPISFSSQSATIHNSTDEDFYSFSAIQNEKYWINLSFIDFGGDLELYLLSGNGTTLDSSTSVTSDEQIVWIATTNSTFYIRVDGHSGNTNTYRLDVETNSSTPAAPMITGILDGANLNSTTGWFEISNSTSGTNYTVDWSLSHGTGAGFTWDLNSSYSWSASSTNSTFNSTVTHPFVWKSDFWCLTATLDGELNGTTITNLDSIIDCWTPTFISNDFISDWKANVNFSNLESSNNFHYDWQMTDSTGTNIHQSGNNTISSNGIGGATTSVSWSYLAQGSDCLRANLWAANGSLIENNIQCFTPTLPVVNFTAFDNTTIGVQVEQLFNTGPWRVQVDVETNTGTVVHTTTNRTWTGNSTHLENWSWTPANSSGWYCAVVYLYSQNGSLWDRSETCIQLNFDDDGDGVLNEDDWCSGTLPGYTVDQNGCADYQKDSDNDGYTDDIDKFPWDHTEWNDTDDDGYGDNGDEFPTNSNEWEDTDGDGVGDNGDAFPGDSSEWNDTDGDTHGDNGDAFPQNSSEWDDTDSDGVGDNSDAFPSNSSEWSDTDSDGCGDNSDEFPTDATECTDTDGDGVGDNSDAFPTDANETLDSDGDNHGDNSDAFPNDSSEWEDSDSDGIGNNADACPGTGLGETVDTTGCDSTQRDSDNDGIKDAFDSCDSTPQAETVDSAGCSPSQKDSDNDGITDDRDQCPTSAPSSIVDGTGCAADERDADNDGVFDSDDLCINTPNSQIADSHGCAPSQKDSDSDTITDDLDLCPSTSSNSSVDLNGCSTFQRDSDSDGVFDAFDQCPATQTGKSVNIEGCADNERDSDGDGHLDSQDQCPGTPENALIDLYGCAASQKDSDQDLVSDANDRCTYTPAGEKVDTEGCADSQKDTDKDGYADSVDSFPLDPMYHSDRDGDGVADELDDFPNDATKSLAEEESSSMIWIILAIIVLIVGISLALILRKESDEESLDGDRLS